MGFDFWFTLVVLFVLSIILVREVLQTEIAIFSALILLVVFDVITVNDAFHGFSNAGVLAIALLFIVAGALSHTGALNNLNSFLFGNNINGKFRRLVKVLFPVVGMSAFTNNTPIVAVYIPVIRSLAERFDLSSSKLLIPVSFAAILGGMCTLIGTSTNLIIHGLLIDQGYEGFSFFEISKIGVPVALFGMIYLLLFSDKLLPGRKEPRVILGESVREYVCELKVAQSYKNIGKTIETAGLRQLQGLFLFQIERDHKIIAPARPDNVIRVGDRLFFTGLPKTIIDLQKVEGLQLVKELDFDLKQFDSDLYKSFEVVVSPRSPLVGKRVKDSNFRSIYNSVILAIYRSGDRLRKKIGDVVLQPGDTLLLLAKKGFFKKFYHSPDFYLISHVDDVSSKAKWQARISIFIFVAMVLLAATNTISLLAAAGSAAVLMVLFKCVSVENALQFIDLKVIIIIASAFGIARALTVSGVADFFAQQIFTLSQIYGVFAALVAIYFLTSLYNTIITSNATAALIFPIAVSTASIMNTDLRPFAIAVTISAAASFATPISYQTNLMVYGPGGYKFKDFLKIGVPLQISVGILALILIKVFYL